MRERGKKTFKWPCRVSGPGKNVVVAILLIKEQPQVTTDEMEGRDNPQIPAHIESQPPPPSSLSPDFHLFKLHLFFSERGGEKKKCHLPIFQLLAVRASRRRFAGFHQTSVPDKNSNSRQEALEIFGPDTRERHLRRKYSGSQTRQGFTSKEAEM